MNYQDSKFSKGSYKRGRARPNRNWYGGGRNRNWKSSQQWHKEQNFSSGRKHFSQNSNYKFGNEFSTHTSPYGTLHQHVQLPVITKKEHIRPKSPFPGSEEYTQRNIEKASDFIKRQLEIDENVSAETYINSSHIHENLSTNCNEFPKYTDFKNADSYSAKSDKVASCSNSDNYNIAGSPKHSFNTSSHQKINSRQLYDVNEIHNKLINHISNLSHAKKVNIINQVGPTGYDLAVQQIQKQKRIELSHALREMCKEQCFNEKTQAINSIIPDFDIPIESLPKEIIEKLSTSLDVYFDDNSFSFSNLQQTDNDVEFPINDICIPIVPETCFQQAENLLKDSLEYLPECKQLKTDSFQKQNPDISDKFLQENTTLNDNSSQGLDVDKSIFQSDIVALPCSLIMNNDVKVTFPSHDYRNNNPFDSIQCEKVTKKECLPVPDFLRKNQNTNVKSNLESSITEKVQSGLNMSIEQNPQQINSPGYVKVLQNKLVNTEIKKEDAVEQYINLQTTDDMTKKGPVKFKPEKIQFEITSRQKLFNKKVSEQTNKNQSKELDNNTFNVKTEKLKPPKETEFVANEITEHVNKQKIQNNVELENLFQENNSSNNNKQYDSFVKNDLVEKQMKTTSTLTLLIENPKYLELGNDTGEQNSKNEDNVLINNTKELVSKMDLQKNKISLNRESYKETMSIINETDYKHSSNRSAIKNKDDIGFSCLTKHFNPYTSYLKPTKSLSEQNRKQENQRGYKNATKCLSELNVEKAKEDLAIEEIVKGFSPKKKKKQETSKVQLIKLKGVNESRDSSAKIDKKKSFNSRRERRKFRRARQRNMMKYVSNDLEQELLHTAYKELESEDKHVKNVDGIIAIDNGKYLNSCSVEFADVESSLTNNTETRTSIAPALASNSVEKNLESKYSQNWEKGNDNKIVISNKSTIQSIYEYENEDLDYDYDIITDISKSTVKSAELKDDEMVRLWEKRAKDVHNINEKNAVEDGKLWNNYVEKSARDVISQDDELSLTDNSKSVTDVASNFDKVNGVISGNIPEEETSSIGIVELEQKFKGNEFLLLNDCETKDSCSNVHKKRNIENNTILPEGNAVNVNNLMVTEKYLKRETSSVENKANLRANTSNKTTFCSIVVSKETKCTCKTECINNQLNNLKNESTIVESNLQQEILDCTENREEIINNLNKTKKLTNCINESNIHDKCTKKNCTYQKGSIRNGKDIPNVDRFQIENKHICSDRNSNSVQTIQKDHRSSSRENCCKSRNKETMVEINAVKKSSAHKTPSAYKTSLNKLNSSRKINDTPAESANSAASDLKKVISQNKFYYTSDNRKRKIRVRNNYSQTEKYSVRNIEVQTENNCNEYNDQTIECEINVENMKNQILCASSSTLIFDSPRINKNSALTKNDAITKLIEIDKQIDNLLKIRQGFYKVLYNDDHEKTHSKLLNVSGEMNTITHENNSSRMKLKSWSDKPPQLKINSTKRRKLKNAINVGKNIKVKETTRPILQDSTMICKDNQFISCNAVGKLNVKYLETSNSKDNLVLGKNKVFKNTTRDDVNVATVERDCSEFNRNQQNVNEMDELKNVCTSKKQLDVENEKEITTTKEVMKDNNEFSVVNEDQLFVSSKSKHDYVSLTLEKKNTCNVFNVKKCNNKRNQIATNKMKNREENHIISKEEVDKPAKCKKRKRCSFVSNNDYIKNLRHGNNKKVIKVSSSNNGNEQNTMKPAEKAIVQENDVEMIKETCLLQKCQNGSYTSETNLENEIKSNCLDEPENKRKRKNSKTETANVETNAYKESDLKSSSSKESTVLKCNTVGLQKEEDPLINNEKCGSRNNLYEEMQKIKCIVLVERLSLEQAGASAIPLLQNSNNSQHPDEYSNVNMEKDFKRISQFGEYSEEEKVKKCAINAVFNVSEQTALKQNTNELNSQLQLKELKENITEAESPENENNMQSDNLRDLICKNSRVEQDEGFMKSLPCIENEVDLNFNQHSKMKQKIASKSDHENKILISACDVERDLEEIFFKNFEGVILVIKVVSGIIIAASDKGKLFCYCMSSGLLLHTINVCSLAITSLCLLKNNKGEDVLYTGSLDVKLNIYNFFTKEKIKSESIGEPIQCMEYAWDYLFIGSDRGSIIRYDVQKEKIDYKEKIFDLNVLVLRATQEGARKVLVVAARNNPVSVRDAMSGLLMRTMETPFCPTVYTLLLEKNFVFCGTSQHDILVYTFEDGQLIFKHEATKSKGVVCMQIVKNLLFAGCYNGNVYIYNIKTNKHLGTMTGPGGLLLSMEIVNGKIIVGTKSNKFKLWTIPNNYLAENENIT